jgi:sortase A
VAINGYIILLPLMPHIMFRAQKQDTHHVFALEQAIAPRPASGDAPASTIPSDNRLIVPSMALDQPIFSGSTASTLNKGLWLRPQGSTPDKGSNTIIVGHRFTYTNPRGTFYHLDAVRTGDAIGIFWEGKPYRYIVTEVKTVKADAVAVEDPSSTPRLTLYTCTPLWLPKDRLVVVAEAEMPQGATR